MNISTNTTNRGTRGIGNGKTQTFSYRAPAARSVQLVGDFTHWRRDPINLVRNRDGVWQTRVGLEPGEHPYRFIVDGEWRDDPECQTQAPNPYGSANSIRRVE